MKEFLIVYEFGVFFGFGLISAGLIFWLITDMVERYAKSKKKSKYAPIHKDDVGEYVLVEKEEVVQKVYLNQKTSEVYQESNK